MDSQADQTFCNYTEILMILPNRISLQVHLSFKNRLIIVLGSTKKLWSDWPGFSSLAQFQFLCFPAAVPKIVP